MKKILLIIFFILCTFKLHSQNIDTVDCQKYISNQECTTTTFNNDGSLKMISVILYNKNIDITLHCLQQIYGSELKHITDYYKVSFVTFSIYVIPSKNSSTIYFLYKKY